MAEGNFLAEKEIEAFLDLLDLNKDGVITYDEIDKTLCEVHAEIAPDALPHHLHYGGRSNPARAEFLRSILGTEKERIPRAEFAETVRSWQIPSMLKQARVEQEEDERHRRLPIYRRIRAYWSVHGPNTVFLALVISMQIAFAVWMLVKYLTTPKYMAALGWGVVLSKTSAGALYPTMFFLTASMSRWLATFCRRSYYISRFINWDLSQSFHIKMSICALFFATTHAIGHLTGSFVHGSNPAYAQDVEHLLGPGTTPRPYSAFIASLPGWTGLTALGSFYTIALMSMPQVRRYSYELFQGGHLLMFVMLGMLCAHGTAALLQAPMLGYFLAFPLLLVICERGHRLYVGFRPIKATLEQLDAHTVRISVRIPRRRHFPYEAGQYVLLQVPQLSFLQWHPFTISACVGHEMQLHIKALGNWTKDLHALCKDGPRQIKIGIDGPFGAPAQRFYNFDHSLIMGSGIGVTPFSGILTDLQARDDHEWFTNRLISDASSETVRDAAEHGTIREKSSNENSPTAATSSPTDSTDKESVKSPVVATATEKGVVGRKGPASADRYRRVDFHWIVKDRNALLWFSDLLNQLTAASQPDHPDYDPNLDVNICTHVTMRRKKITTHVYRHLLERHRTDSHPVSPLTGLVNPTSIGRPDLEAILTAHYEDMCRLLREGRVSPKRFRVGVFFCGTPIIGMALADLCRQMTLRAREDRTYIEYFFMMEVFV